ncbi:MAG: YhjD/YihY/BrkB family envelope integrity protein, partial [Candidatus Limnocylindrales bacterium]
MKPEGPPPKSDLIGRVSAWVLELPPVRWLKPIMDDYGVAGGGLLASGVAFNSLFAVLPAILLVVSLLGLTLDDPLRLEQLVQVFAQQFPPLEEFFRQAFDQFRAGAVSFSVLGLVGLVWGSSRFYQSLDEAIARIFRGSRQRDPFQRGLRGVLSVGLLIGAVVG